MGARPLAISLLAHAALIALLAFLPRAPERASAPLEIELSAPPDAEQQADPPAAATPDEVESAEPSAPARPRGRRRSLRPEADPGALGETAAQGLGLGYSLAGGGAGGSGGVGQGRGGMARREPAAVRPPPRRVSRARPPRLVYPKRFRDERDGEVFVALLTVDEDGWVVGVRLVRGVNPHADQKALEAVWRFHYQPALDAAGHPVRARVQQRFMVD